MLQLLRKERALLWSFCQSEETASQPSLFGSEFVA